MQMTERDISQFVREIAQFRAKHGILQVRKNVGNTTCSVRTISSTNNSKKMIENQQIS